ncbi:uncharacterized protein LOC111263253 isoform X2 [Varroa jacobsoni]|uniref:Uncharacterized protein n=1 Tax=Varroa destructor TaxID=109461 RepID=A0A7M7KV71_VARDE|nr:uncharacterized protein LOC111255093 isoform X2 [Varroa destructor]XP_022693924.1 uncharacterized protein LOC111263253 isoform X2 [Varroa jacobsoni]
MNSSDCVTPGSVCGGVLSDRYQRQQSHFVDYLQIRRVREIFIRVHSCEELYKEWKHTKPGWENVSANGFTLEVPFIHTGLDRGRQGGPNVVALHGAPGSHRDFDMLIPALDHVGANVIVPTFPDLHYSMKTQNYWHSLEEKTDLLKSYLEAIDVKEVDILLCHSSAMYSAIQVALNSNITVNSMVFFAPAGCRQLTQLSPLSLFHWYNRNFRRPWAQKPMMGFAVAIIAAYSKPSTDTVGTVTSMMTMIQSRYDDAEPWCRQLHQRGVPTLLLYGKRDKLIDVAISEEMAGYLGNPHKDTYYLYSGKDDTEAIMTRQGVSNYKLPEVVCFEHGSHFAFRKFPETYNFHVANFLQRHIRETLNK